MIRFLRYILDNIFDCLAILIFVGTMIVLGLACPPVAAFRWADRRVMKMMLGKVPEHPDTAAWVKATGKHW